MKALRQRALLDHLYACYNRRDYVRPDPVETLYPWPDVRDREIVGLIAAGLAFGGVGQILKSIDAVIHIFEGRPRASLEAASRRDLMRLLRGFRHRWVDERDMTNFLWAVRATVREHGSLETALSTDDTDEQDVLPALVKWVERIRKCGRLDRNPLLPDPSGASACKRLHLYLRWMVRKDAIDPGGWTRVAPAQLIIPLDTHMHRIAREMRLTRRKQADLKTAREITRKFKRLCPHDPVRYDFVLTRFGIRKLDHREDFARRFRCAMVHPSS